MDLAGAFYAPGNWREKYNMASLNLKNMFGVEWRDNGNSFSSCFQFESLAPEGKLHMRIKYYYKTLALM